MQYVAHSARRALGIKAQPYAEHVQAVVRDANTNMECALRFRATPIPNLQDCVQAAALVHDLGKLESENQAILCSREKGSLPINHVDAGCASLIAASEPEAALASYCHHRGLCELAEECAKEARGREDTSQAAFRDPIINLRTDQALAKLLEKHRSTGAGSPGKSETISGKLAPFERRLLLSCLVDADHHDTARNYRKESDIHPLPRRWKERLTALDTYVETLSRTPGERTAYRTQVYQACRNAGSQVPIWACDSPVGSGKTTAVMAYLLKAADELKLRHIFVVMPYTNIVSQSVKVYREVLTLPGEDPEKVVAAHHHQAEFASLDIRYLTTLWDTPIICTTAVQFFETLAASGTARLRKLHELPGSAVFVDEAHAAMPIHLWPFMWQQLQELATAWKCRFVLASGSLARFWENGRIMKASGTAKLLYMAPDNLRQSGWEFESRRIHYESRSEPLTLKDLGNWIQQQRQGPRLVVMNTVQSAAAVARELRGRGLFTKHLSTALAPRDREVILNEVDDLLRNHDFRDWVLVATSCVEAGIDFSFRIAFRERSRASSLVQIGGRVNRHGSGHRSTVWDFVVSDPLLPAHPDFTESRDVVEKLFQQKKDLLQHDVTEAMTWALGEEFKLRSSERKIKDLFVADGAGNYPEVARLSRLITADTRVVVIDKTLVNAITAGRPVDIQALRRGSVQLWATKIESLRLTSLSENNDLYSWDYEYDPHFLGIMEGILKQDDMTRAGGAII